MQALQAFLRRGYATHGRTPRISAARASRIPTSPAKVKAAIADIARTQSTPLAVRIRRAQQSGVVHEYGDTDATPSGLTPSELARYNRRKALGGFLRPGSTRRAPSEAQWLRQLNARRRRIRGSRRSKTSSYRAIVGQRVYLPNFLFRLIRNYTPPGEPYNPFEATFRVPLEITKNDVRSFLYSVYGVRTTYIRTDVRRESLKSQQKKRRSGDTNVIKGPKTYKRAVVGLVDPFYYPQAVEDMSLEERAQREDWIEEKFMVKYMHEGREMQGRQAYYNMINQTSVHRPFPEGGRQKILEAVWERRRERERALQGIVQDIRSSRQRGELVDVEPAPVPGPLEAAKN